MKKIKKEQLGYIYKRKFKLNPFKRKLVKVIYAFYVLVLQNEIISDLLGHGRDLLESQNLKDAIYLLIHIDEVPLQIAT